MTDSDYINDLPEHLRPLGLQILDYYEIHGNEAGGNLHIVLDDGNWQLRCVEFCRRQALAAGDADGVAIADALLKLPDEDRKLL